MYTSLLLEQTMDVYDVSTPFIIQSHLFQQLSNFAYVLITQTYGIHWQPIVDAHARVHATSAWQWV